MKTDCENTLPLFYQYVLYKPISFVEIVNGDGLDLLQLRALLVKHIMEKEWQTLLAGKQKNKILVNISGMTPCRTCKGSRINPKYSTAWESPTN